MTKILTITCKAIESLRIILEAPGGPERSEGFLMRNTGADQRNLNQALGTVTAAAASITGVTFKVASLLVQYV